MAAVEAEAAAAPTAAAAGAACGIVPLSARAVAFVPATADEAEELAGEDEEAGTDDGSIASSGERAALRRAGAVDVAAEWAEVERARARVRMEAPWAALRGAPEFGGWWADAGEALMEGWRTHEPG